MRIIKNFTVAIMCSLLMGCGSESGNEQQKSPGLIPEHQLKALEDAKGVEQMLLEADEQRRKTISENE